MANKDLGGCKDVISMFWIPNSADKTDCKVMSRVQDVRGKERS